MRKFTLPAGTTNRHKWHKDAAQAIGRVAATFNQVRQLYGVAGVDETSSLVSVFSYGVDDPKNPEAVALYEALGERFGWQITRENAADVAEAFREALPAARAGIPVEDNRRTPAQDAERAEQRKADEAARQAAAAEKAARVEALAAELRKQYPAALGPDCGKSGHARAAANFKAILQARGLRVSVKSDSFSMGNSVTADILTPDLPPAERDELQALADRFSYGTFDPMTDCSGYDHSDEGEAGGRERPREVLPGRIHAKRREPGRDPCVFTGPPRGSRRRLSGLQRRAPAGRRILGPVGRDTRGAGAGRAGPGCRLFDREAPPYQTRL